jgi:Galactose oxidase, central domain/Kelch motif
MNGPRNLARVKATLALALFVSMIGYLVPVYSEGQRSTDRGTISQTTMPTWVPTGNLNVARDSHTATLLPNGKVLVVGGRANDILDSAELYDPAAGTWSVVGHMSVPRVGHAAALLSDGRVLVVGGDTSNAPPNFGRTATAELYDYRTGTWSTTGNMTAIRSGHTATLLQNGKVLVAGGFYSDTIRTAELYDPATGTWSNTGSLNVARYWHTATLLLDGRVLVAGGSDDGDLASTLSDAELYDPATGRWGTTDKLSTSMVLHTATLLQTGKILVAGGYRPTFPNGFAMPISLSSAELYDPAAGTWSNTGNLNASRDGHTATMLPGGEVLVVGGEAWHGQYPNLQVETLSSAESYDSKIGGWAGTSSLNATRSRHTATLLADGRVLVAGGGGLAGAELYGAAVVPPGTIGPGFTGSWYDPAQSGHGLFIEVLPGSRLYAAWFAFNPAGTQQTWFTGVGTYSGSSASITAVEQPTGGRWIPNFDPYQVVRNAWGTLTFTFTDCDHGSVEFNSVAGYGMGSMNLTRLTQPAGLSCP